MSYLAPNTAHRVQSLLASGRMSTRRLAEILKAEGHHNCSQSTIKRWLRGARPAALTVTSDSERYTTKHGTEPTPAGRRAELHAALMSAPDREAENAASLALYRFDVPMVAAWLDGGATRFDAVSSGPHGEALWLMHRPEDLAALAIAVSDDDFTGLEDGETNEDHQAFLAGRNAEIRTRAIALLEGAIAIVRAARTPKRRKKP